MKNILLLTQIYPGDGVPKSSTPVVHYFAREWVKMGYNVCVLHYSVNFPRWAYFIANIIGEKRMSSLKGGTLRMNKLDDLEYVIEGVQVRRICLRKTKPHGRFKKNEIEKAYQTSIDYCKSVGFVPDIVVGHWLNPTVEFIGRFKHYWNIPSVLCMHDAGTDFNTIFKNEAPSFIKDVDCWGFRSNAIKRRFEAKFGAVKKSFMCYSGIPAHFLDEEVQKARTFESKNSFIYVGTMISRKYPSKIIPALVDSFPNGGYILSYIGDGNEVTKIKEQVAKCVKDTGSVKLLGRLTREEVKEQVCNHDFFVMISKNEVFGLVYLEAMATGCIPIASRDEGFDGIIKDGYNGFLCEAGNENELAQIITNIRKMTPSELKKISYNAFLTAKELTDVNAAKIYVDVLKDLE